MPGRESGQPGLFEIVSLRCGCLRGAFETEELVEQRLGALQVKPRRERQVGLQVRASRPRSKIILPAGNNSHLKIANARAPGMRTYHGLPGRAHR